MVSLDYANNAKPGNTTKKMPKISELKETTTPNKLEETAELEKIATQNEQLEETDQLEETGRLNKPCSLLKKKTPWSCGDGPRWTPPVHGQPMMPAAARNL